MLFVTSFVRKVARTAAALQVRNTEVSAFGILTIGVVMCDRPGSHFQTSPFLYTDEKG